MSSSAISIRLVTEVPSHIAAIVDQIAVERGLSRSGLVRQALGVIQAMHEGAKHGLHTGMTRDREKLDTLLVGPL
jgi:hypothetical protein